MTYNIRGFRVIPAGFGGLRGGGGQQQAAPTSTTTTNTSTPWGGQQPYLKEIFKQAQAQYNDPALTPKYFEGAVTAAPSNSTLAAQQSLTQGAGQVQGLADSSVDAAKFNLGAARDVTTNPYIQRAVEAAVRPIQQQLTDTGGTLSQIRDQTNNSGQWGGSTRGDIAAGLAVARANQQIGDTAATMYSDAYKNAMDNATKTLALTPGVAQTVQAPGTMLDAVGQQQTAYSQQLINDAIDKWNFQQNLPAAKLAQYQSLIQGNYGGQSSGTSTSTGGVVSGGGNSFMSTLGTGLSALGTLGKLFALF